MASPRPSLSNVQSPSSSRTSLEVGSNTGSFPPSLSRAGNQGRRNRAALRDYYGLKTQSTADVNSPTDQSRSSSVEPSSQDLQNRQLSVSALESLDREGFDAGNHVRQVLEVESLQSLLALENELVSEIKNLDGERKALVYDNYSKLISATETIKKMRSNMDPLSPATSTLSPAISHISETAATFAQELSKEAPGETPEVLATKAQSRNVVQWALGGPERLKSLVEQGDPEEAHTQWLTLQKLLDRWENVKGSAELRAECLKAISPVTD